MTRNIGPRLATLLLAAASFAVSEPPAWRKAIEEKLAKPAAFDFRGTPLKDVLKYFQDSVVGTTIIVDRSVADRADRPVSLRADGVPAGRALSDLLKQQGLGYRLEDEAIFVTAIPAEEASPAPGPGGGAPPAAPGPSAPASPGGPQDAPVGTAPATPAPPAPPPPAVRAPAPADIVMRVYDIRALLHRVQDFPGPEVSLPSLGGDPRPPGVGFDWGGDPKRAESEGDSWALFVRENVRPASWGPATSIAYRDGRLVVNQTAEVHREILKVLARFGAMTVPAAPPPGPPPAEAPAPAR